MSSSNPQNDHPDPSNESSGEWTPCPKGTLGELSNGLRHQAETQQRRKFVVTVCAAAGLIAVGGTTIYLLEREDRVHPPNEYGGISCAEVKQNLVAFRDGSLDQSVADRIRVHVKNCSFCAAKLEELA